jgi:two-component system, sporulation sensor kinase A
MNRPIDQIKNEMKTLLKNYLDTELKRNWKLFTQNQDAIFILDLDGKIVEVNPTFKKLSEYSSENINTINLQSLFPIESLDKVFNHFHKTVLGQFQTFDCKMVNRKGKVYDLNIIFIPINVDDQTVGLQAVAKDITHLKRKNQASRKVEDIHSALTDYVSDIILCTNLQGNVLYVTPSCEQILGYSADELMNQQFLSYIHAEDYQKTVHVRKEVIGKFITGRSCYRLQKKDGEFVWVEALCKAVVDPETNNILEVVSVIRDITERKKADDELWNRKKAFRDLVEHSPDAVLIAKEEKILFINETGIELLGGKTIEDILSKSLLDFVHKDYHPIARKRIEAVYNGEIVDFLEYKVIRLDGTILDSEVKAIPTFYEKQSAHHIILRDITERKKTQEHLLQSEKLSIAGQLAAGIAHEVRNPLTTIKGFLQLMELEIENKNYLRIIQSEMDRIELILSELLVLAKPQDTKFHTENLKLLIEDVTTLYDSQAIMKNVQIDIVHDSGFLMMRCDKNQLKQVLINFLKNSVEAMPNGGNIKIETTKLGENKVKILIQDTGTGIPQHILKKIGQPFFTTKEGGTGLGVMISKQIIKNHNGTLHFWSDRQGTIIEIILPI